MKKVLITGAHGMLAADLIQELEGFFELYKTDLEHLDICDAARVLQAVRDMAPDFVINCAAYTNVDGCESEKQEAFSVNGEGAKNIALACKAAGCNQDFQTERESVAVTGLGIYYDGCNHACDRNKYYEPYSQESFDFRHKRHGAQRLPRLSYFAREFHAVPP